MPTIGKQDKRTVAASCDLARDSFVYLDLFISEAGFSHLLLNSNRLVSTASCALRIPGASLALTVRYVYHVASFTINSSHHFVSAVTIFPDLSVGHGIFIHDIALRTPASFHGVGFPSPDVSASGQTFPLVRAFSGSFYVGHTNWPEHSWPEHAQCSLRSWGLIGMDCALWAIRLVFHIAPCAINSSHHIICIHYTSHYDVGHDIFIHNTALRTPASFRGVVFPDRMYPHQVRRFELPEHLYSLAQALTGSYYCVRRTRWPQHLHILVLSHTHSPLQVYSPTDALQWAFFSLSVLSLCFSGVKDISVLPISIPSSA